MMKLLSKKFVRTSFLQPCNRLRKYSTTLWKPPVGVYTGLEIYNCVAKQKVAVSVSNKNCASWYTCGPTVYDKSHLGHASCYVKLDIIQRILRKHFQINLVTAMNITDIDDKIIAKSIESRKHWKDIALENEDSFFDDLQKLKVTEPDIKLRVTDNMDLIIEFIAEIVKKEMAYVTRDGSVYFKVRKYPGYGKLQKIKTTECNQEYSIDENGKSFEADFALWKAKKHAYEPSWKAPWGEGRPGWHIECSALASYMFGSKVDFHAGGIDLRFPHHENEDAQSCIFHNTNQWVNYWLHVGHLHIKGDQNKMSKSLKNTVSVDDMLDKYGSDEFRMACLLSNYKNSMEYSDELMETASNTLRKFKTFESDCIAYVRGVKPSVNLDSNVLMQNLNYAFKEVESGLCQDFNTAYTINVLLDQISSVSRCINNVTELHSVESSCLDVVAASYNLVQRTLDMYGIGMSKGSVVPVSMEEKPNIDHVINSLIETRFHLRQRAITEKDSTLFQVCDEIRNCLIKHRIEVKDHINGSSWEFIKKKLNEIKI